ncbi:MAG: 2-oxoglutarate dehydrogenase E1 component [Methylococcales bacterium]
MKNLLQLFKDSSAFYGPNAGFIEDLYEKYLDDPDSVEVSWREKFRSLQKDHPTKPEIPHSAVIRHFAEQAKAPVRHLHTREEPCEENIKQQTAVARMINHYRVRGHQLADTNPLGSDFQPEVPDLDLAFYGLSELNLDQAFDSGTLLGGGKRSLREIVALLQQSYCGRIGCEFMHILDTEVRLWVINRVEMKRSNYSVTSDKQRWLLKLLTAAEGIERFLHRKYVGQKRFSLEGGECLIPVLDELIQRAGENGAKEIVLGMAHRGRLNVLINILGKNPSDLFEEFEGKSPITSETQSLSGDVKYHMGFSSDVETPGGPVHLALAFNPSHLEIINPVVEGSAKARQDRHGKGGINAVMPILIHGDAAFAGQGVIMETLNMSETRSFSTGGTVHIVINNQIGFTVSNPFDARSTLNCTDVAYMIQAPVFHVNGDDPEAVLFVTQMALDYRMTFKKDVVIDLICYRRHGHNEADEPSATQPMMYQNIRNHPTTREIYSDQLIKEEVISSTESEQMTTNYQQSVENGEIVSRPIIEDMVYLYSAKWNQYTNQDWEIPCDTTVSLDDLRMLSERLLQLPQGFVLNPRVAKIMDNRQRMAAGALALDWGFAENMAYATILVEGHYLRLTGQDVGRGTFFHRHAILFNQINGESYIPLKHLQDDQGRPQIFDSLLSEEGVLGFEYGYSTTEPNTLVIWEAQFGDFANGAQVLIDQFISSGEAKWGRKSGLTLLLPHGYEGQGPEHSSARLERYLQLCAEDNMQVCVPTTPAQIFHLLRRQIIRPYRKPLIVMSPKSLLRHKMAVSSLEDLTYGSFQPLIGETDEISLENVSRIVLCSGKVYYDLLEIRRTEELDHIAILRIEQLYPFPLKQLSSTLKKYPNVKELIWCQEEPKNQGAWHQIQHRFLDWVAKDIKLGYAGRPMAAAPAGGNFKQHIEQQKAVVESALHGNVNQTHESAL